MKKQFLTVLIACLAMVQFGNAQEKEEKKFGVKWSGYVNADYIFDSRRISSARQGQLLVLPLPEKKDAKGKDLNAESTYSGYAIESRLSAAITGPDAFGMKTKGVIEGHFFGAGGGANSFSLRHAYFTLSNDKVEILFGQYWHPTFVTNVSPGTLDYNAGIPFQSFNRSPQIRFSTKGNVRFIGTLLTELDFPSKEGSARHATLPTVNAQLQFGSDDSFVAGVGVNVKTVDTNRRLGGTSLAENKNKTTLSFLGYAKAQLGDAATWKVWTQYGGNTSELLTLASSGFNSKNEVIDADVLSLWTEFSGSFGGNTGWGMFVGYASNMGFSEKASSVIHFRGVANAFRISPRITWSSGKVQFGFEPGYTSATYYKGLKQDAKAFDTKGVDAVGNFRALFSATYSF